MLLNLITFVCIDEDIFFESCVKFICILGRILYEEKLRFSDNCEPLYYIVEELELLLSV